MKNDVLRKVIKTAALHSASKNANSVCAFFFYQPKLPEAVKRLRRF
jgi:cyclic lactone autoinducer peptide